MTRIPLTTAEVRKLLEEKFPPKDDIQRAYGGLLIQAFSCIEVLWQALHETQVLLDKTGQAAHALALQVEAMREPSAPTEVGADVGGSSTSDDVDAATAAANAQMDAAIASMNQSGPSPGPVQAPSPNGPVPSTTPRPAAPKRPTPTPANGSPKK